MPAKPGRGAAGYCATAAPGTWDHPRCGCPPSPLLLHHGFSGALASCPSNSAKPGAPWTPAEIGAEPVHFEWSLMSAIHARMVDLMGSLFLDHAFAVRAPSASKPGNADPVTWCQRAGHSAGGWHLPAGLHFLHVAWWGTPKVLPTMSIVHGIVRRTEKGDAAGWPWGGVPAPSAALPPPPPPPPPCTPEPPPALGVPDVLPPPPW